MLEVASSLSANTATTRSQPPSISQALYQTFVSIIDQCSFYAFGRNTLLGIDPNVYEAIYRAKQQHGRQTGCERPTTTPQQQGTLLISLAWALDQNNMEYIVNFLRENNHDTNNKTMIITNLEFRLCNLAPGPASTTAATLNALSTFLQDDTACKLQTLSLKCFPLGTQGVSQLPLFSTSCNTISISKLQLCNIGLHGVEGGECLAALLLSPSTSSSPQCQQEGNGKNQSSDSCKNTTLQVLDCSDNQLGPEGAGALFAVPFNASALRTHTTAICLKELNLSRCSIGDHGIHLMALALSSTNNNTDTGSIRSTTWSCGLTTFNLSENQLTWACLTDLSTIIQCGMTKLEHLVLSDNEGLLPQCDRVTRAMAATMETKRRHFWKTLHQNMTLTRLALDGCNDDHDDENDADDDDDDDDDCQDSFYTSIENDILRRNVYLKRANVLLKYGSCARSCISGLDHHLESLLVLAQGLIYFGQDTTMAGASAVFLMIQQGDIINSHRHGNCCRASLPKGMSDTVTQQCRRGLELSCEIQQENHIGRSPSSLGELLVISRTRRPKRTARAYINDDDDDDDDDDDGREDSTHPTFFDPFGLALDFWADWIIAVIIVMAYSYLVTTREE